MPGNNNTFLHSLTTKIFAWLHGLELRSRVMVLLGLVVSMALVDYHTGYELGFSFFYLLPVSFAAWFISMRAGLVSSLVCAAIWGILDVKSGHAYTSILFAFWNSVMRLGFYVVVVKLLETVYLAFQKERNLSQTDFLTGAYNRRFIYAELSRKIALYHRTGKPFVVAYFDLDNFKTVNDTQGHGEGDRVLITIVRSILAQMRPYDMLGRMGGDEFILLLPETNLAQAELVVRRLKNNLLVKMQEHGWPVTFSIGLAEAKLQHRTPEEIIHDVDNLMYEAKIGGKDSIRSAS